MKISEMIKNLQTFKRLHGDLECWYAEDDEGNGYHPVYFAPTLYYVDAYNEVHNKEEVDNDYEVVAGRKICIIN